MFQTALDVAKGGVVVFAPHPDDEVFGCGGLVAMLVERGIDIHVVIVSDGGFGEFGRDTLARKDESRRAAKILGYRNLEFWDLPDQGLQQTTDLHERMGRYLQEKSPTLVLATSPWEIHPDHIAVCHATTQAYVANYGDDNHPRPALWYYEIGIPMPRAAILDITDVADLKAKAMNCFESQLAIQDYANQIAGLNIYRGYTLGRFGAWGEAYLPMSHAEIIAGTADFWTTLLASNPMRMITKINALETELRGAKSERDALYQSTSWRMTAPLRALIERLRKPRQRG